MKITSNRAIYLGQDVMKKMGWNIGDHLVIDSLNPHADSITIKRIIKKEDLKNDH